MFEPFTLPRTPGLRPLQSEHQSALRVAFGRLNQPISDYAFANVWVWRRALGLSFAELHGHACVFATVGGDMSMLMPPLALGPTRPRALAQALGCCFELMDQANADRSRSRIEYVSDELLETVRATEGIGRTLGAVPMSGDFVYPCERMVDLAGGPLKPKRKLRHRFERAHPDWFVEPMSDDDVPGCLALLSRWRAAADASHAGQLSDDGSTLTAELRRRETDAAAVAIVERTEAGLSGMTLRADGGRLMGFTLGEALSPAQASVLIEKTEPGVEGAPQVIFAEFCRLFWSGYPEINAGDDWGIPTLRHTKNSYRPSRRLSKYVLCRVPEPAPTIVPLAPSPIGNPPAVDPIAIATGEPLDAGPALRPARPDDLEALLGIERRCFEAGEAFSRRQVRGLLANPRVGCTVADDRGRIVGWAVTFLRRHARHLSGRLYNLAVEPDARGRGIGAMLLDQAVLRLTQSGAAVVYLEVRCDNAPAQRLYETRGFRTVRILRDYFAPGVHALSMKRRLIP